MKYNEDILMVQYPIVECFVQHLAYYRAAKPIYEKLELKSPFWCATIDAHIQIAALNWCKVFGARSNLSHWSKLSTNEEDTLNDLFRERNLSSLGITQPQWSDYHRRMCDFRNKYIAHSEIYSNPVPDFNMALNIACIYDEWVRDIIKPDGGYFSFPSLRHEFEKWLMNALEISECAMGATRDI